LEASTSRKNQIQELRSSIAVREGQLQRTSAIVSDYTGRVLELTVTVGQRVPLGWRLGTMEVEDSASALVGLTYFPIKTGKKVQAGMRVLMAPDTIERERFGSLLATVTWVSAFPVTKEGMLSLIGNAEVVATLAAQGPILEVVTALTPDPETFSQYKWSSSQGPPLHTPWATTATARVLNSAPTYSVSYCEKPVASQLTPGGPLAMAPPTTAKMPTVLQMKWLTAGGSPGDYSGLLWPTCLAHHDRNAASRMRKCRAPAGRAAPWPRPRPSQRR
jgi:hypothetical protein